MRPTMYSHKWKKWGVIISAIGLALMIAERLTGFILIKKLSTDQHYAIFEWVMFLGLVTIMYSKEKIDDDRAKMIRLKSFQVTFLLMISTMLAFALSSVISAEKTIEPNILFFMSALGIFMYLLLFHLCLYFDFLVEYKDITVEENLRHAGKTRWGMLAFYICAAITLLLLFLL